MRSRARAAAARSLADVVEVFEGCGFAAVELRPGEALLERDGLRLRAGMVGSGRVFGGSYALEVSTDEPALPPTQGLAGRGRGAVRLARVAFRPRRGDAPGTRLAGELEADERLQGALRRVHFERIRVESDGRPVIRHLGGSVVWMLFPPLVRAVPLVPEQAEATAAALLAFAAPRAEPG